MTINQDQLSRGWLIILMMINQYQLSRGWLIKINLNWLIKINYQDVN